MPNMVLAIVSASLIVVSTVQMAAAAGRYTHKSVRARAPASRQFRDANDVVPSPSIAQQDWAYYNEGKGHGYPAPFGR
jgi:hypothetical protein